ncbi:Oxysterol-binding isoform C [Neolecta irregularis DAH-3]|uniref:Oxysterol-binding isoform C n=1 Tax=Neolecta irregularis (strain DAH-3) TaxID=1198029 RepID=A0A1U7LLQ5_NEOID|nr:Oxysterol-binding isoform C [Neolecta irregularis DAH-3]|eukprot:OLL23472.1 Oxysterol-binding isoform C [Neolecta irregularis DAH-3]
MIDADIAGLLADLASLVSPNPQPSPILTRTRSRSSDSTDDFFDAYDDSPLDVGPATTPGLKDLDSDLDSELDSDSQSVLIPPAVSSLSKIPQIQRRQNLPVEILIQPPSLLGLLRKNVGKDLSTVTMPVSANEPLNLLQKLAEELEYSEILDKAATLDPSLRLLYVAAFATSSFSNMRAKERSIRKPFNPLLGETFELIREDKGFRFIAEKVSHRPPILAVPLTPTNLTTVPRLLLKMGIHTIPNAHSEILREIIRSHSKRHRANPFSRNGRKVHLRETSFVFAKCHYG